MRQWYGSYINRNEDYDYQQFFVCCAVNYISQSVFFLLVKSGMFFWWFHEPLRILTPQRCLFWGPADPIEVQTPPLEGPRILREVEKHKKGVKHTVAILRNGYKRTMKPERGLIQKFKSTIGKYLESRFCSWKANPFEMPHIGRLIVKIKRYKEIWFTECFQNHLHAETFQRHLYIMKPQKKTWTSKCLQWSPKLTVIY